MLTMRIIRMAYQPIHLIKPLTINPYKQSLRTMPYVNQRHASDSKKLLTSSSLINKRYDSSPAAPKITTDTSPCVTPKATAPSCAPPAAPSATPQKSDSQSPCQPSASPQKADCPQPLTGSSPSSSSSATSDSSSSSQCQQPTASASQTSDSTSSTSTTSSPKTSSTPSTEQKSSTDSTKPPEIKLPSREQLEKYFFRATVVVWDTSVYLYSVTSRLFDQYVLRQPILQQYWAVFKKKMDQARQEMRSK